MTHILNQYNDRRKMDKDPQDLLNTEMGYLQSVKVNGDNYNNIKAPPNVNDVGEYPLNSKPHMLSKKMWSPTEVQSKGEDGPSEMLEDTDILDELKMIVDWETDQTIQRINNDNLAQRFINDKNACGAAKTKSR